MTHAFFSSTTRVLLVFVVFMVGGAACAALVSLPAAMPAAAAPSDDFVTVWSVTGDDMTVKIPVGGATGTYTIDWGDGNTSPNVSGDQEHTYAQTGTYLNGFASSDPDGDAITYGWTSSPSVTLRNADTPAPSFTAPAVTSDTTYTLTLTVSDGAATATDTVVVTVLNAPVQ